MTLLSHDRYCDEIGLRVGELEALARSGADLGAVVPTCPEWSLEKLLRHVGEALGWVERMVRAGARERLPDVVAPEFAGDGGALGAWLAETGRGVVDALREAGPTAPVWSWTDRPEAGFWARRMAHEVTVHGADAAFAAGRPYAVAPEVAADTLDEWLEIVVWVQRAMPHAAAEELRGSERGSLHLHATDVPGAEWIVEWGPGGVAWRRGHERADVVLRGPLTDVMLAFCRRLPLDAVEVLGERRVVEYWLARAKMG
ncbi:maleylpyruvate isomerase family mycothiol-dependent enzyme [Streptomyces roseirectus]|uniref:Maleylpyruvate isomerase family mycothiol-dependent enzyme n=1 Tax=Streptomyces roseirectus TaxID=2768066 RepID=A0A7H0IAU2_9ACTN|nr:maleylpyruvate isomerase family mycothiol-dependent enzyme [Streptomyces roseirectus]QNP69908.1 maleylpyruvate isomerase family mycothiol-dependent enzyme [Streptomyces roseirectus]